MVHVGVAASFPVPQSEFINIQVTFTTHKRTKSSSSDVYCTLSWLVSAPHTLVMFGKTSDHPAVVQFLLMLPAGEEMHTQSVSLSQ